MIGTAILDITIGTFLLFDFLPWLAALVGAVHLVIVLTVSGITDITVRDIGLLVAALAIMIDSLPQWVLNKIGFVKKQQTLEMGQSPEIKNNY